MTEGESTALPSVVADVDLWVFLALLLSCFVMNIRNRVHIPTSALLMLAGLLLRTLGRYVGAVKSAVEVMDSIEAETILLIFLPALIFECAFSTDWYTFKREIGQIILLATSAVLVSSILTALVIRYVLGFSDVFGWYAALMLGAILSATDHVAVVAQLKEVKADSRLETLMQGETLVNEGSVIVIFTAMLKGAVETSIKREDIAELFFRLSLGGVAVGLLFSYAVSVWLKRLVNETVLETLLTVITTYLLFFSADATSLHFSGAIGTVTFGLYMSAYGKTLLSPLIHETFHEFWEILATCFESLILILGGMLMGLFLIDFQSLEYSDIGALFALFALLHCVRAATVLLHWPLLRLMGYGCSFKEAIVLVVGALKGTISIALALMVYHNEDFSERVRDLVLFWSVGVSALSATLDSILLKWTIRSLGLESMTNVEENMLISVTASILESTNKRMMALKEDEAYAMVNWETVEKAAGPEALFQDMLKATKVGKSLLKAKVTGPMSEILQKVAFCVKLTNQDIILETRRRYFTTLKGLYWERFEEHSCLGNSASILIESANRSLDRESEEMHDWSFVYAKIYPQKLLRALRILGRTPLIGRFFKTLEYSYIKEAYDVTRNFISEHIEAEKLLDEMEIDINEDIFAIVMKEPHVQIAMAQQFLTENITDIYPEVCRYVQTYQATASLLYKEKTLIEAADEDGVITEIEFIELQNSLKRKLKRLRDTPAPKPLSLMEMLQSCRLFQDLPREDIAHLARIIRETLVEKQTIVFNDKEDIEGVYVVLKGRVREAGSGYEKDHFPGDIVGIQYLLPTYSRTKTAAFTQILTTLGFIPYSEIQNLLANSENFERKLWLLGAKPAIMVSREQFGELGQLEPAKMDILLENCEYVKVAKGQEVLLSNGLVLLRGQLSDGNRAFSYLKGEENSDVIAMETSVLLLVREKLSLFIRKFSTLNEAIYAFQRDTQSSRLKLNHSKLQVPVLPAISSSEPISPTNLIPSKAKELLARLHKGRDVVSTVVPEMSQLSDEEVRLYEGTPRREPTSPK